MADQIFISYRRNDAAYVTGHINDLLRKEFGDEAVFTDVDNIALGVDFRAVIDQTVSQCQVFLAVIGSDWLNARDQDGNDRLRDPGDFVRIEIESALKRSIPVIPLLVSGAKMPLAEDLPDSIRDLAYRNGTPIRPAPDFTADMARLIKNLRIHFDKLRTARGQPPTAPARTEPVLGKTPAPSGDRHEKPTQEAAPGVRINVAADESARKRAELGIGERKKRSWAAPLWVLAIVIGAGAGWYYTDQNPGALQGILSAIQSATSEGGESPGEQPADYAATEAAEIPPAASPSPSAATEVVAAPAGEPIEETPNESPDGSVAIDDLTAANTDVVESQNPTGGETDTLTDEANASLEAAISVTDESTGTPVATEDVVAEAEPVAESSNGAPATAAADTADEVTLTPGSQRQSDASALISEGVRFAGVGDHEDAIANFSEALTLDVEPAFVYKQRGASYQALGQYDAAISDYGQAIDANSEDLISFYNRGVAHMALGDHAAAIADFDVVIQLDPEFVDAYSRRADAHEATGNEAAAARDRSVVQVFQSNQSN